MLKENEIISRALVTIDNFKGSLKAFKSSITDGGTLNSTCPIVFPNIGVESMFDHRQSQDRYLGIQTQRFQSCFDQLISRDDMKLPWNKLDLDSVFYHSGICPENRV